MKVKMEDNYRSLYTLTDVEHAKIVIAYAKEYDSEKPSDYAFQAAQLIAEKDGAYALEVLKAEATTSKNHRIWNQYGDSENTSSDMDIWIDFTARVSNGFVIGGAYLSDIWQLCSDNKDDILRQMFVRRFTEVF